MQKILLAEDDPNLGDLLKDYLELKGKFDVTLCTDGDEAISQFKKNNYDLCIFDVMMPKKDGFTVGREIRKTNNTVPIIFATAKGMMEDKTEAFELGGDDYITKPFRVEELLLRIYKGQMQKLSTKEAELLRLLCLKKNDVLTREEALLKIWHDDNYFTGRSMDVFLSKLRKYLKEDSKVEIVNVHGKGYKLLVS